MTRDRKAVEPPLRLDMDFNEAMSRLVATEPAEVEESIDRSKTKRPPGGDTPRRPVSSKARKSTRE